MRTLKTLHHPNTTDIADALEVAVNVATNAFIALVFIGGILLGLAL